MHKIHLRDWTTGVSARKTGEVSKGCVLVDSTVPRGKFPGLSLDLTDPTPQKAMSTHSMDREVNSVGDLYDSLKELQGDNIWIFRGHSNPDWWLIPKAGRSPIMMKNEVEYFKAWKRRAVEYVSVVPTDDWDWLSISQHHGFPTRLLDWTRNPLIAAFFAASDERDNDGVIFAFRPRFQVIRERVQPHDYTGISAFRPSAFAARISRQSGNFTIHGPPDREIVEDEAIGLLRRYIVPRKMRESMVRGLDQFGCNAASIFPDLDGLSSYMNWLIRQKDLRLQITREENRVAPENGGAEGEN